MFIIQLVYYYYYINYIIIVSNVRQPFISRMQRCARKDKFSGGASGAQGEFFEKKKFFCSKKKKLEISSLGRLRGVRLFGRMGAQLRASYPSEQKFCGVLLMGLPWWREVLPSWTAVCSYPSLVLRYFHATYFHATYFHATYFPFLH